MSTISRRLLLKQLVYGALAARSGRVWGAPARDGEGDRSANRAVPRYLVQIHARGGIDAIRTMDPKRGADIDGFVSRAYTDRQIVRTGQYELGPDFAPLARYAQRMSFVRGVHVNTANHPVGTMQFRRLRTGVSPAHPTLVELIGTQRSGQALGGITLNTQYVTSGSPSWTDLASVLPMIEKASEAELRRMADAADGLAGQLTAIDRTGAVGAENAVDAARFLRRAAAVARPDHTVSETMRKTATLPVPRHLKHAIDLQTNVERTAWLIENNLARAIFIAAFEWDTHVDSHYKQAQFNGHLAASMSWLIDRLAAAGNKQGSLLDQTLIVVGSELGRFPKLNSRAGKDHFPEVAYGFIGAGIAPGRAFGQTTRTTEATMIDLRSGTAQTGGHRLTISDIGTTILRIFGFTPEAFGYTGETLEFLRA